MSPDDIARSLARAPFALLAWVLAGLVPADLLGTPCRPLVLRVLLDVGHAVRAVSVRKNRTKERATLDGLEERSRAAIVALGEDYRALTDEALPTPTAIIEGPTVARVMFAFADELEERGLQGARFFSSTFDKALCDKLATRASAIEAPSTEHKGVRLKKTRCT